MFPRASWANLITTSPIVVTGLLAASSVVSPAGAMSSATDGVVGNNVMQVGNFAFNGSTYDQIRTNAAAILSAATQSRMMGVANPGEWSTETRPGANTVATVSRAAGGAGVRHILRSFVASLTSTAATASSVVLVIRDGASGAGTIIFSALLAIPATADSANQIAMSGLNLVGSPNTAMTIEFTAAGGASTTEQCAMSGYDTI